MPVSADTIRELMAVGVTGEALVRVVECIDADMQAAAPETPKRSKNAERQARYRERLRNAVTPSDVTSVVTGDATRYVTRPPNDNISNPPRSSLRSVSPRARAEWFSEFWSAYPRRTGTNPKQPAQERFFRLLRADPDPETLAQSIIDGAKRFAASIVGEDPRFTMQAKRWLNEGCWKDDHRPAVRHRPHGARDGPGRRNSAITAHQKLTAEFDQADGTTVILPGEDLRDPFLRAGMRKLAEYERQDRARSGAPSAAVGIASAIYPGNHKR